MAVGDIWQLSPCVWDTVQLSLNALHYQVVSETGAGATAQEVADDFDGLWSTDYKALTANTASYLGVLAQRIRPLPVGLRGKGVAGAGAGTAGAIGAPTAAAGLIRKQTNQGGRRGAGRIYIGFMAVADIAGDGSPTGSYVTRLGTLAATIIGTFTTVGAGGTTALVGGVWSKKFGAFFPYTQLQELPFVATQRRRSFFGRPNTNPFA